jgi:plastocyanin
MIEELWSGFIEWTSQFVVPDWGKLVLLIPLLLAALVFLYLTWTAYRFATAQPKRRGMRKQPPVTPKGIHMPGPSFAPFLVAIGGFFLVFGMVAGGIWLWVGVVIVGITLLYWGREELRNYDKLAAAETGVAAGALPAPRGTPPAGVHIPPPSFRPLLVSIAATMLVGGMVFGGWLLILGVIAVAVTLVGWLRDSRREYTEVEEADETGHLPAGNAPAWPIATFAILAVLVLVGIFIGTGILGGSGSGTAAASASPGASAPAGGGTASAAPSSAPASLPAADVTITAQGIAYTTTAVTAPAGKPFTIAFDNQDPGVPHDVVIKDAGGAELFKGDLVTGPKVVIYDVPALPAGQYTFVCTVHPNMTGTVTAQ